MPSSSFCQNGLKKPPGFTWLIFFFAPAAPGAPALVAGVVVEVARDYDAAVRVKVCQTVSYVPRQLGGGLTQPAALLLAATARRPMVDNHAHTLAAEKAEHAHLVAGAEVGELRQIERVVGYIYHPELLRVVEKADIDSTPVGRVVTRTT